MGGILAKTYGNYRQRRYRRWKLQMCFTKFGTITINPIPGVTGVFPLHFPVCLLKQSTSFRPRCQQAFAGKEADNPIIQTFYPICAY